MLNQALTEIPTQRILITGSNGMIGDALMQHLLQKGFEVRGMLRTPKHFNSKALDPIQKNELVKNDSRYCVVGDINEHTDWTQALKDIDVVIHTAACVHQMQGSKDYDRVNHLGTHQLAKQAAEAGVKRLIFLSSIKAMGEQGHFDALTFCKPEDDYGQSKLDAEQKLFEVSKQYGMEIVILRLPLIYGPGVKANFRKLIQLVKLSCFKRMPLPFKGVNNARSMMGLRNLIDLITCCIDHPNATGKIYLPSDGEPISTPMLMRKIADAFGKSIPMFTIPTKLLILGFGLLGKKALADRLLSDLTVDRRPVQEDLSWQAPFTVDEELRFTLKQR
jgi:nucleoside-diphosphate-sugar epimerase